MNIILLGYRGSGKTSVGKMLAEHTWKTFVDLDAEVCKRFGGRSVAEIWKAEGEAAFRKAEAEAAREFCAKDDQVIALGGGTLMDEGARAAVRGAKGVRIYLKCEPEVLYRRIKADHESDRSRPALTKKGGGLEEVKAVLAEREPVYLEVADKVFDMTHLSAGDAIQHIIKRCL